MLIDLFGLSLWIVGSLGAKEAISLDSCFLWDSAHQLDAVSMEHHFQAVH